MSSFSLDQEDQLTEWFASSETVASVKRRIDLQNERSDGLAPWPRSSIDNLYHYKQEAQLAIVKRMAARKTSMLGGQGLAQRENQAAVLAETIQILGSHSQILEGKVDALLSAGALDVQRWIRQMPMDDVNSLYHDVFEGQIRGRPGAKAPVVITDDDEKRFRLETGGLTLGDAIFVRWQAAVKAHLAYLALQGKFHHILGQLTGSISGKSEPMNYEEQLQHAADLIARHHSQKAQAPEPEKTSQDD